MRFSLLLLAVYPALHAQWTLQDSHVTAGLRGVHHVRGAVVWASGTGGTILRTTDGGTVWQKCTTPPDGSKLDFRGIFGFDEQTAVAMSSGTGALSRVYRTTDGCSSWKLMFSNPDPSGFWDAIQFSGTSYGLLIGDPVEGRFPIFQTRDGGQTWQKLQNVEVRTTAEKQSIFAASNSSLFLDKPGKIFHFLTGGVPAIFSVNPATGAANSAPAGMPGGASGGGFSLASRLRGTTLLLVAVGGDYKSPEQTAGTAARWIYNLSTRTIKPMPVESLPGGYRSAVAYDSAAKASIAVGPGGTDISKDDGARWQTLHPHPGQTPDADKKWNSLSWPYVVGPEGRIGKWSRQ